MRNSEVVSKLLCPTHSFGCASMTLRKKETGKGLGLGDPQVDYIRFTSNSANHVKTVSLYENSLTSEYCQELAMVCIASLEIVGVTKIGSAGTWAMLETDKMQHSH